MDTGESIWFLAVPVIIAITINLMIVINVIRLIKRKRNLESEDRSETFLHKFYHGRLTFNIYYFQIKINFKHGPKISQRSQARGQGSGGSFLGLLRLHLQEQPRSIQMSHV